MQHTQVRTGLTLEARIASLLAIARVLCDFVATVPTEVCLRSPRIDRLLADLAAGKILQSGEGDGLEQMANLVLNYFERVCPGHLETLFKGSLEDFPLDNLDWSRARMFWDVLLRYRVLRQDVLDEVQATRIAADLRNARFQGR